MKEILVIRFLVNYSTSRWMQLDAQDKLTHEIIIAIHEVEKKLGIGIEIEVTKR